MSDRRFNHMFIVNVGKIGKRLRRIQFGFGLKNTPRHRQIRKARKEEQVHEFKSNY